MGQQVRKRDRMNITRSNWLWLRIWPPRSIFKRRISLWLFRRITEYRLMDRPMDLTLTEVHQALIRRLILISHPGTATLCILGCSPGTDGSSLIDFLEVQTYQGSSYNRSGNRRE